mgnify:CR=1 FL=1
MDLIKGKRRSGKTTSLYIRVLMYLQRPTVERGYIFSFSRPSIRFLFEGFRYFLLEQGVTEFTFHRNERMVKIGDKKVFFRSWEERDPQDALYRGTNETPYDLNSVVVVDELGLCEPLLKKAEAATYNLEE